MRMNHMAGEVKVRVPATSANLGSGFDTAGLALDYCDELTFTRSEGASAPANPRNAARVIIHGEGEDTLPRDETHLVVAAFRRACRAFGLPHFGLTLEAYNRIPQARGMGSSAEAIVAGVAAAAVFAYGEAGLDSDAVFALAAQAEGHPDNVAPAVYGGLTVSWDQESVEGTGALEVAGAEPLQTGFHSVGCPVSPEVRATVFVPDFELSTQQAREALPGQVPYADAIHNVSRAALLPIAMNAATDPQGNRLLFAATQDRLHQPYRKSLMTPSWTLIEKLRAGGFAAVVSGAGPCVLVLHYGDASDEIDAIAADELASGHWRALHLPVSAHGVSVAAR